ncbi:MAG: hypothetical protein L3J49_09630 [Desulfobulbaceae bacterium]|nr:hypothetical protein [Desulfobulbaceae bacterium]
MRVAIASTDGETVNEHFGRAERFFIYDITGDKLNLVTVREVTPLSTGDKEHLFDGKRMAEVLDPLKDCTQVYCTRIGERPEKELAKSGIKAIVGKRSISEITEG